MHAFVASGISLALHLTPPLCLKIHLDQNKECVIMIKPFFQNQILSVWILAIGHHACGSFIKDLGWRTASS
jgi:hypothetical protein